MPYKIIVSLLHNGSNVLFLFTNLQLCMICHDTIRLPGNHLATLQWPVFFLSLSLKHIVIWVTITFYLYSQKLNYSSCYLPTTQQWVKFIHMTCEIKNDIFFRVRLRIIPESDSSHSFVCTAGCETCPNMSLRTLKFVNIWNFVLVNGNTLNNYMLSFGKLYHKLWVEL